MAPLLDIFDPVASSALNNTSLQEIANLDQSSVKVKAVIYCFLTHTQPQPNITLMVSAICQAYHAWSQDMTTSLSGQHLGLYHALLPKTWRNPTIILGYPHHNLECSGPNTRISRQIAEDCYVEDQEEDHLNQIQQPPHLHIVEAGYNMFLKLSITKQLMPELEQSQWILDHQHGSCYHHSTANTAFYQIQVHSHLAATCQNAIEFNTDALACFNYILPDLTNSILQPVIYPTSMTQAHVQVLTKAHYHIKMAFGISKTFHQHLDNSPVYDTSQGPSTLLLYGPKQAQSYLAYTKERHMEP